VTTTEKGITYGFNRGDDWLDAGNENFEQMARTLLLQWANKRSTTTGLTYGYYGGVQDTGSAFTFGSDSTIALTDNATNYVERTKGGTVSKNTTGFTYDGTKVPMAKVTTSSGAITVIEDWRFYSPVDTGGGGGSGACVQVVNTQTGAVNTGSTAIPVDDTIPQNTEGVEFMTLAVTPTNASNKLKIDVVIFLTSASGGKWLTAALFQDSTANALATQSHFNYGVGTAGNCLVFSFYMTAGTTSATTFKVRAGCHDTTTVTFNGQSGGRLWGGACISSITITELTP
jgi:hypothetical protein